MKIDLIYVYCLTNSPPDLGHNNELPGLISVSINGFFVIAKIVQYNEFSEENFKKHLSDIKWLETNAREHIRVIGIIMMNNTVVPFKFGTIFQNKTNLKKFITDYSDSLNHNFFHIEGKEEWSVKIYCDRRTLSGKIDELSEEAAELEKQIMESSPGKAFLLNRKKADIIGNEMDMICKQYGQEYFDVFKNLSESVILNNLLPKEITGREETMILNAAFLLNKNKLADFKRSADLMNKKDGKSGFLIETTGPWPPFSFISIKELQ